MDEFDTLLAGRKAVDAAPADEFEALLAAKPKASSKPTSRPGEIPSGSLYTAPPAAPQSPPLTAGRVAEKFGEAAVDVGDIVLGGLPAVILGSVGEVTQRLSGLADGRGYREGAKAGAEFSRSMGEKFGRPLYDNLKAAGVIKGTETSLPQQAMEKIGGWLEHAATIVEADTNGVISKEDYLASVNGFMAAMGVKGLQATTQGALNRTKARGSKSAWDSVLERFNAEEQLARDKYETRTPERKAAESVARPPEAGLYGGNFAEQAAARRAAYLSRKAYEKSTGEFPPSGERTGSRSAVDLALEGKETPTSQPHNQPFHTADATKAIKRGIVADTPIETEGRLGVVARPALDTALEKVKGGRLFDMTAEERIAIRNSVDITDPKVITAAAVGATGLGLAMAFEPSVDEAALAIGAGALLRRGGEGLPMRELLAKPEATPLGVLLESSAYTTSTLEKLADSSPGKFEFKKTAVEQLLKREGVTKHERDLMAAAMAEVPRDTITAKELMVGLKLAAKDFELTPTKSDSYADYGLERIDRTRLEPDFLADLAPAERDLVIASDELKPTSRVYRSPLELGSNNHFQDPNYFAHTRSFVEDGIRHIVELQSDLAQKAGKVLKPEERAELRRTADDLQKQEDAIARSETKSYRSDDFLPKTKDMLNELEQLNPDVRMVIGDTLRRRRHGSATADPKIFLENALARAEKSNPDYKDALDARVELNIAVSEYRRRIGALRAEQWAKIEEFGSIEGVSPMLKDWHKRLVREELADAARQLEGSVRFATADTVAKVEGWPEGNFGDGSQRFLPEHQGIYDRYSRDVEKFLRQLGGKPITDSAGHTWLEVPLGEQQKSLPGGGARTQIGGVDPALLKGAAAVGGAAGLASWLSAEPDKKRHAAMAAAWTGLFLLARSRVPALAKMGDDALAGVQYMIGNISTDASMTPAVLRRLTNLESGVMKGTHDFGKRIAPFVEILDRLPASSKAAVSSAVLNGRTADVLAAVGKAATPGLLDAWNGVRSALADLGKDLVDTKVLKTLLPDYFPRIVKDLPGLLTAIGKEHRSALEQALKVAESRAPGGVLDDLARAEVVNKFLEKNLRQATGGKASFFKRRTLGDVTVDLESFYVEPGQALPLYISSAVRTIERAKFFGKDLVLDPADGKPNLEASIGNVVSRELDAGKLTPENFERLQAQLRTVLGPADQSPHRALRAAKQVTDVALLANVFSGMMNLADIGGIVAQHGLLPVASALVKKVRGKAQLTAADVGMADAIGAEFVYGTRDPIKMRIPLTQRTVQLSAAKATDALFRYSGFKAFDTVMKEVNLNAAMEKYSRLSRTKAGETRIRRQYDEYFTTDMPQLLSDLRAGAKTKLTTELAFRELSDAQPTTKIEMPKFYLDHPNLRFGWALKSFMIKQLNLVKKRGVDEIRRGNTREGMGFIIRYGLMAGAAGATMDMIVKSLLGRESDMNWGSVPFAALKNIGLSEFIIDKTRQGKYKEAAGGLLLPPTDPVPKILMADPSAVRYFPLVGRLVYDRAMDGAEKANAAKKLSELKKAREDRRTPAERRELERRAAQRRKELTQ